MPSSAITVFSVSVRESMTGTPRAEAASKRYSLGRRPPVRMRQAGSVASAARCWSVLSKRTTTAFDSKRLRYGCPASDPIGAITRWSQVRSSPSPSTSVSARRTACASDTLKPASVRSSAIAMRAAPPTSSGASARADNGTSNATTAVGATSVTRASSGKPRVTRIVASARSSGASSSATTTSSPLGGGITPGATGVEALPGANSRVANQCASAAALPSPSPRTSQTRWPV